MSETHTFTVHGSISRGFTVEVECETDDPQLAEEKAENLVASGDSNIDVPDGFTWRMIDVELGE